MDQLNTSRLPARTTPTDAIVMELAFCRVAEGILRHDSNNRTVDEKTLALFEEAVGWYFGWRYRPTARDCYRQLEREVLNACGTLWCLPSERTFNRRIAREKALAEAALAAAQAPERF